MAGEDEEQAEGGEDAPRPRAGAGEVSEKQLKFIKALIDRIKLTDEEIQTVLKDVAQVDTIEELDRRGASAVIDELQVVAKERGVDLDSQPKASEKQVGFMKQLKRRAHMTDDEFAAFLEERAGVTTAEDVGKRDASTIIDELLKLADSGGKTGGAKAGAAKPAAGAGGAAKKATARKAPADKAPPPAASAPASKKPAAKKPAADDDDDRPPDRMPPPGDHDADAPAPFDGPDDADLERDPGPENEGDDLPF